MEENPITMDLGEKIDITMVAILKSALDELPITAEPQLFDARHITHMDSASCQLFYVYMQHLIKHNTTLVFLSPSDKFMAVVKALGFESYFNYTSI